MIVFIPNKKRWTLHITIIERLVDFDIKDKLDLDHNMNIGKVNQHRHHCRRLLKG